MAYTEQRPSSLPSIKLNLKSTMGRNYGSPGIKGGAHSVYSDMESPGKYQTSRPGGLTTVLSQNSSPALSSRVKSLTARHNS